MTLEMTSEAVLLTCPMLGMEGRPCPMSTSHHLVVNLADIRRTPKKSLPTKGDVCAFYNQNTDWDVIHLSDSSFAGCPACEGKHRPHTYDEHCRKSPPQSQAPHPPAPPSPPAPRDEKQPPPGLQVPLPAQKSERPPEIPRERVPVTTRGPGHIKKEEVKQENDVDGGKELLYRKIQENFQIKQSSISCI